MTWNVFYCQRLKFEKGDPDTLPIFQTRAVDSYTQCTECGYNQVAQLMYTTSGSRLPCYIFTYTLNKIEIFIKGNTQTIHRICS